LIEVLAAVLEIEPLIEVQAHPTEYAEGITEVIAHP